MSHNEFQIQDFSDKSIVVSDPQLVCIRRGGKWCSALRIEHGNCDDEEAFFDAGGAIDAGEIEAWRYGSCADSRIPFNNCWLPDQYAIQWSWGGNGDIASFNALTNETTYYGKTEYNNAIVGGYALAFRNDAVEPALFFQTAGKLYKADPSDPIGTFTLVGSTAAYTGAGPGASSSYPCFDFIDGQLLVGDGNKAWEVNQDTGESTYLGKLVDIRDGLPLSVAPGDWFADPNG
ncbi:MAG TPA: hypothetical protein PLB10_18825, partial [Thiolinea sp.]|nr:hypothetical protein [Thiolinea sp.]